MGILAHDPLPRGETVEDERPRLVGLRHGRGQRLVVAREWTPDVLGRDEPDGVSPNRLAAPLEDHATAKKTAVSEGELEVSLLARLEVDPVREREDHSSLLSFLPELHLEACPGGKISDLPCPVTKKLADPVDGCAPARARTDGVVDASRVDAHDELLQGGSSVNPTAQGGAPEELDAKRAGAVPVDRIRAEHHGSVTLRIDLGVPASGLGKVELEPAVGARGALTPVGDAPVLLGGTLRGKAHEGLADGASALRVHDPTDEGDIASRGEVETSEVDLAGGERSHVERAACPILLGQDVDVHSPRKDHTRVAGPIGPGELRHLH